MEESRDSNWVVPTSSISALQLSRPRPEAVSPAVGAPAVWKRVHVGKVALFVGSLYLFILAITLMKDGSREVAPLLRQGLAITNVASCLGFGWLFANVIMSGSPVAAAALTFFDAGTVDKLGAFAMIAGSRLGASFIVLFIGFLYVLRGRDRATSLGMGLLSLTVTVTTYVPALVFGAGMLQLGTLDRLQLGSGTLLHSVVDLLVKPINGVAISLMPGWGVFVVGLGIILLSFNLFDRCLPEMTLRASQAGRMSCLVDRPGFMFALGAMITFISMSVSLSLSVLVPLSNRGLVRRENVIPYIMGANITTFIDTLLASVLLDNPAAFTVVLVEMFSIAIVSIVVLTTVYRRYERAMLGFVAWVTAGNQNLAVFVLAIFTVPIVLMVI